MMPSCFTRRKHGIGLIAAETIYIYIYKQHKLSRLNLCIYTYFYIQIYVTIIVKKRGYQFERWETDGIGDRGLGRGWRRESDVIIL